jgi:hypothetical protein
VGAKDALMRYYQRQVKELEREQRPKRKNAKPEFELKKAVMKWLGENGFSCHTIESKATYSFSASRYLSGQSEPGMSDIVGCTPDGIGAFIELKAPGRRSTLKEHQREFLVSKIKLGAFAVCVDSVKALEEVWTEFQHRRRMEPMLARTILLRHLPQ